VQVVAVDNDKAAVDRGVGMMKSSLDIIAKKAAAKGTMDEATAKGYTASVLSRVTASVDKKDLRDCDIVVEVRVSVVPGASCAWCCRRLVTVAGHH
jgi:3-hydroxyacyl-CoA dehydrogenase